MTRIIIFEVEERRVLFGVPFQAGSGEVNTLVDAGQGAHESLVAVPAKVDAVLQAKGLRAGDGIILADVPVDNVVDIAVEFGTTIGTATEGNDSRVPTQDENNALIGTDGTPSSSNAYVTDSDPRNSDSRTSIGAASGDLSGNYPAPIVSKIEGVDVASTAPIVGQVLTATSPTAANWQSSAGDVTGPASAIDNEIVAFDGTTGKTIKRPDAALNAGGQNITSVGTVDGRDLSVDGTKLDGIETGADVTDTANVQAALPVDDTTELVKGSVDATKRVRIEADGLTPATTRILTMPDADITPDDASAPRIDSVHRVDLANPHAVTAAQAGADPVGSAAAVQTNLTIHEGDTSNPHDVTLGQVGGAPVLHASQHQNGGTDEVATTTAGANAIPKALGTGVLDDPWISQSAVTQHEGAIDHDALANFDIAEHRIINDAGTSTIETWSASKIDAEVSAIIAGVDIKPGVDTTTTGLGNITLSGEQTLNGLLTSASDVLVTEQTIPADNGLYVSAVGAWSRRPDADTDPEVTNGNIVHVVNSGSAKFKFKYLLVSPDPIVVGTDAQTWEEHKDIDFGTTSGTATEGNDPRVPSQDENDALIGTSGTPSAANRYLTNSDARNSDARTPTGAANGGLGGTYPNPSVDGMTAGVLTDDSAHGVRGGGTQHADVIAGGASGFITGASQTKLDDVAANAIANIVEDTTPQLGGDLDALQKKLANVSELRFDVQGASQGILYKDVGGGFRSALIFPGSDLVVISNRASNGSVQVRANNVAAGVAGEQLVAVFAADRAILIQPTLIGAGGPQDTSSQLEIISTNKGFLPPRMTNTQRDAISSPASGLSIYDLTNEALNFFNGAAWRALLNSPAGTLAAGSLLFATGKAEVDDDSDNLFWDDVTKQLGVGTNTPATNAILDLVSTTKGFVPPRWTDAQEAAVIATLDASDVGLTWCNTTTKKTKTWDGAVATVVANEADVVTIVSESFAATNARFFGELGLPASQGWTDTATGAATIDLLNESVFGVTKQVVRHNDDFADGSIITRLALTAQNWIDIRDFGASYSGISRLDTINGASGFFSGIQANAAENPLATGNRRYGISFDDSGGNLRVRDADAGGSIVIFDGTGGNPQIDFDEYVAWECVVPAGLGAAQFYVNGVLSTFAPLFLTNAGGLGTLVLVGSGSTAGVNRVAYHDNFGVTIYEESSTKTLAAATMAADVSQVFIPEGKRDYEIVLPDGNPRSVGAKLEVAANNVLGQLIFKTETPAAPEALFNGLQKLILDIAFKEVVSGINTVANANVYIGFNVSDSPTLAQLSSNVDQIPVDTNPVVITFNTQDEILGITHSVSTNPGEITIVKPGLYSILVQPQIGKDSGATPLDMNIFLQRDVGSGFKDVPNSNVILGFKDQDLTDVIVVGEAHVYQVGEKLRFMQKVSATGSGIGLRATAAQVGPPTVPATPSIILKMKKNTGRA